MWGHRDDVDHAIGVEITDANNQPARCAGLARAKADGTKLGRPKTEPTTEKAIRERY
jgi:hypothetical protein